MRKAEQKIYLGGTEISERKSREITAKNNKLYELTKRMMMKHHSNVPDRNRRYR